MAKQESKQVIPSNVITAATKSRTKAAAETLKQIQKLHDEITQLKEKIVIQKSHTHELRRSLSSSSVRRMSQIERFSLKEEIHKREHQIKKLRDMLANSYPKTKGSAKISMVRAQYSSKYTVQRYGRFIEDSTVKLLNQFLAKEKPKMTELKKLAAKASADNVKLFNEELLKLFNKHDAVTYTKLTANVQYKKTCLEKIRITVAGWDFDKGPIEILAEAQK